MTFGFEGGVQNRLLLCRDGRAECLGGIVCGEHSAEPVARPVRGRVPGAQEQPTVGPDRVDGASSPAVDLLGQALPDFGEHVVAKLDQVERVDGDRGAWEPHS